jgi:hypothetical protein
VINEIIPEPSYEYSLHENNWNTHGVPGQSYNLKMEVHFTSGNKERALERLEQIIVALFRQVAQ